MESNLLLEQYSRYKKMHLESSPFKCLLNEKIEKNPHQINAFCAAVEALKTGGIILADEVGLGKTIEAGLVLQYVLDSGAKKVLIALPVPLKKQWEIELAEKFGLEAFILDRVTVENNYYEMKNWIENKDEVRIILTSYDYSSKLINRFEHVKWDFIIIDEAHHMKGVFQGTKRAKNLYRASQCIPKLLLTATPLQNSLHDLYGLVSFIDPRIFGSEKVFEKRFIKGQDYTELKNELRPVLYRTLRRDVGQYMNFTKRECRTMDFQLTDEENHLYNLVNNFLQRDGLYSIPTKSKEFISLRIRKILASSSFAIVETFEVIKNRLEKLYQGTRSADAQEGFDLFWEFVEEDDDDDDDNVNDNDEFDDSIDVSDIKTKEEILEELVMVREIIDVASSVTSNAKMEALKKALDIAFSQQAENDMPQKAVVFTESKRTQKYIAAELRQTGYDDEDILIFNGDLNEPMTEKIYRAWIAKNHGNVSSNRNIESKHAIVEYFKDNAKILIATDVGAEGLNLQFCNIVINYDLPWNPQRIEQRIGRCHRYGQKHDVLVINLLNTDNEADKRVYDILQNKFELFEGVFGASDVALGVLDSGRNFEKSILDIYQKCVSQTEFTKEFDKLDRQLDSKRKDPMVQLSSVLLTESPESKGKALEETRNRILRYRREVIYWDQFPEPEMDNQVYYWKIDYWGEENLGAHGTLFLGAFCDNAKLLFPVLLLCDESGEYIDFDEDDIVKMFENADDADIHYFKPTTEDINFFEKIHDRLTKEMTERYIKSVEPIIQYNRKKMENWVSIQKEQITDQIAELNNEVEQLLIDESMAINHLEKCDILKKADEKKRKLDKLQGNIQTTFYDLEVEAENDIAGFEEQFKINPILKVNIVLKF